MPMPFLYSFAIVPTIFPSGFSSTSLHALEVKTRYRQEDGPGY
jgi:hypothetical protein